MRVKNMMTKDPKFCVPTDTAQHAAGLMRDEHAGIVPVVESAQSLRIVGVVTDRDLCMNVVAEGRDPRSVPVEECMTTNEQHELLGIVALADVVERATPKATQTHETLKKVSAPTEDPSKPRAQSKNMAWLSSF